MKWPTKKGGPKKGRPQSISLRQMPQEAVNSELPGVSTAPGITP